MLAITPGEPAGIGPDLLVALARKEHPADWVALADPDLLRGRASLLGYPLKVCSSSTGRAGELRVQPVPLACPAVPGELNPANAEYVLDGLRTAVEGCLSGRFAGMVTGPVQKSTINDAGFAFSGHTEFLRDASGVPDVLMLLAAGRLRVALATTHLPLREVPGALTAEVLASKLDLLLSGLRDRFALDEPRILVTGLNPHAGEAGHLGREEIETIGPVCERFRRAGANVIGPLPADTAFTPRRLEGADAVLAMYHDQGLIRQRRERHARPAVRTHVGGPRHGAGHRRQRHGRHRQPGRRACPGGGVDRPVTEFRRHSNAAASRLTAFSCVGRRLALLGLKARLVARIWPRFPLLAPCRAGAAHCPPLTPLPVLRRTSAAGRWR